MQVVVSASVAHMVRCYRGVSVAAAHRTARSARLPAALHQSQLFGPGGATVEGELRRAGPHVERELEIPGEAEAGLGSPPRDRSVPMFHFRKIAKNVKNIASQFEASCCVV